MKQRSNARSGKTAQELMAELSRDPEFLARSKQQEEKRRFLIEQNKRAAAPVVEALANAGFRVESIADLFVRKIDYRDAIQILLDWLPGITNPSVKEDIVRALSVEWARRQAAGPLLEEFDRADDPEGTGLRWAIANALAVTADETVFEEIVRRARDARFGPARQMLVLALGRMRHPEAEKALGQFLADEQVAGHAIMALGELRAKGSRPAIERFLQHEKAWVRREAKKALARLDR